MGSVAVPQRRREVDLPRRNSHHSGNPAWYEWKCRAAHDVLVHFRWFPGD
jgi:hypothetical protein